jgi:hypothetical protein
MNKAFSLAGATVVALATSVYAQDATVTCDDASMAKLKSEAEQAKEENKTAVDAAIGDAAIAMQAGNMEKCVADMQRAMMEIKK